MSDYEIRATSWQMRGLYRFTASVYHTDPREAHNRVNIDLRRAGVDGRLYRWHITGQGEIQNLDCWGSVPDDDYNDLDVAKDFALRHAMKIMGYWYDGTLSYDDWRPQDGE